MKDKRTFFFFPYSLSLSLSLFFHLDEKKFALARFPVNIQRYLDIRIGEGAVFFTLQRAEIRVFVRERGEIVGER